MRKAEIYTLKYFKQQKNYTESRRWGVVSELGGYLPHQGEGGVKYHCEWVTNIIMQQLLYISL